MISLEVQNEIVRLRAIGTSYDAISKGLEVSKPTVIGVCDTRATDIDTLTKASVDTANLDFVYATEQRSKIYRELIGKLHTEITSRDISTVSTERLFTMLVRTERSLSAIEQRTLPNNQDPFADMSDTDLEKIIKATNNSLA